MDGESGPSFSFATGKLSGAAPAPKAEPQSAPTAETGVAGYSDLGRPGEASLDTVFRWTREVYENDVEWSEVFSWLKERSNSERGDWKSVLRSLPEHFKPSQLPPPLRDWFIREMKSKAEEA